MIDRCAFRRAVPGPLDDLIVAVLVYVDDILVMGDQAAVDEVVARLEERFPVTSGGQDYLGLEITDDSSKGQVHVTQKTYARKLLERFGYHDSNAVPTPVTVELSPLDVVPPASRTAEVLGSVGYLATRTMPWLLFAFGMLATIARPSAAVPGAPTAAARVALARVLRYLRGNQDLGLTYTKQDEFRLDAWVDASHGREVHQTANGLCKSRSGGFIKASGASVCALSASHWQATTALSRTSPHGRATTSGTR